MSFTAKVVVPASGPVGAPRSVSWKCGTKAPSCLSMAPRLDGKRQGNRRRAGRQAPHAVIAADHRREELPGEAVMLVQKFEREARAEDRGHDLRHRVYPFGVLSVLRRRAFA